MLGNRSIPAVTVIPVLAYADLTTAVRWLCDTFGFVERLRIGDHRVQLVIGDDGAMVAVPRHGDTGDRDDSIMVRVADVDAHYAQAQRLGARVVSQPATFPYGERQYTVVDLDGHVWTFTQSVADVDPASWGGVQPTPSA